MNLNPKTIQSAITSAGLVVGGALAWAGIVSETSATEIVQQAVNAAPAVVASIGALSTLALTIYKAFQHTDSQVVRAASALAEGPDPQIKPILTLPTAAPAIAALAKDDSVPGVQPAVPTPNPYATQRMRS